MIPEFLPDGASQGERRVFAALQSLPDDVVVYYEPVIRRRFPDFIVIAPTIGVIVIEVKGIPLKAITNVDTHHIAYTQGGSRQDQPHPSRQALAYMRDLMNTCQTHPSAAELKRDRHFSFAFGHLAIMTSMRRADLDASVWAQLFPGGETLCADEFDAVAGDPPALMAALKGAVPPHIPVVPIPPKRMRAIRSVVSPASRVETGSLFGDKPPKLSVDVLDLEQERVARQLGSGHRIIYGVPGSGKTIVLIAAARLLAESNRSVLMLCFNRTLQHYLAMTLKRHANIAVHTFGVWGRMQGAPAELNDMDAFGRGLLSIVESGRGDSGKYDAVLIDEGQDFPASWFQSAVLALKEPADGTLIIAYDVSQNLYRSKLPNWSKVGVKAQGRTKRLTLNYRNTREIVSAAWSFGVAESAGDDDLPHAIALRRENCARLGAWPVIIQAANQDAQISRCVEIVSDLLNGADHLAAQEIMVLCVKNSLRDRIAAELDRCSLTVNVRTIHDARGLQAKAVILVAAEDLQGDDGRALMYVALTRPTDQLFVLWSHDTPFVKELMRNLEAARSSA
ncbi:MAG TPA: NERD domain-containing protein [Candidatus Polarisedimenticolia bacterium]|nr:NERD domain-containing protein [Candidatus Polarisedimenticolia bacterium]